MPNLTHYLITSAERYPQHWAIEFGKQQITYANLLQRSSHLAHLLTKIDNALNIAICLPKSIEMYTAIFGVLLSGKCFVPMNIQINDSKLKYIFSDSRANAIITTVKLLKKYFPGWLSNAYDENAVVIAIINHDRSTVESVMLFPRSDQHLETTYSSITTSMTSSTPCYILYTSGSTGAPKGILHTHGSARTFIDWAAHHLQVNHQDIIAHKSDVSFDLSIFDIFVTIKCGAKLIPVPEYYFNSALHIINFIRRHEITILYTVPSTLIANTQLSVLTQLRDSSLRHLVFAGEPLITKSLIDIKNNIPSNCRIHNWYGPTETNVCTYYTVPDIININEKSIPIGKACPYATLTLDAKNTLLIESESLMQRYWNNDTITQPYESGDIVRIDDENYHYIGRADRQFKFRGYRVQPEEIEQTLNSHPDIDEAAVVITTSSIIAYMNTQLDKNSITDFCRSRLDKYMIPTEIIMLTKLPRNDREKVNYKTLHSMACL